MTRVIQDLRIGTKLAITSALAILAAAIDGAAKVILRAAFGDSDSFMAGSLPRV